MFAVYEVCTCTLLSMHFYLAHQQWLSFVAGIPFSLFVSALHFDSIDRKKGARSNNNGFNGRR